MEDPVVASLIVTTALVLLVVAFADMEEQGTRSISPIRQARGR